MKDNSKILYIIPARGGSKGIPHKNIKKLAGKPLICYSIDVAKELTSDNNICVSTDDNEIIKVVENYGLKVPFKRPEKLATDTATTNDVLLHTVDFYEKIGKTYEVIVLLQPTSPLRTANHVKEALALYTEDLDMVVSVKESQASSVLCEENKEGFVELTLNKGGARRQDTKTYYEYNGAIYIINTRSLKEKNMHTFLKSKKYVMDEVSSIDIDSMLDFMYAELFIKSNY